MPIKLTVDFYRVRVDDVAVTFEGLLTHINSLAARSKNLKLYGDVLRLHTLHIGHQIREGDLTRIRLDDLPDRASLEGELAAIDLGDEEGLAEQAAFLYRPSTQVLLLQRNRHSLTARNFANYIAEKGGQDAPIFFDPVLQEDALQRLGQFQEIRRFEVRFARVDNAQVFSNQGHSTKGMIDLLEYYSAPSADLVLSMGRQRGSLPIQKVKAAARALFGGSEQRREHNEVTRIEISGKDADGDREVLDLVKHRMVEVVRVEGEGRRLPYAARRVALREAYENRKDELSRMFRDRE